MTTFKNLHVKYPDYTYKEATLNPTNPQDRASDWEVDIINGLRDHPDQKQIIGERETPTGQSLYFASPIVAAHSCMECHSTPSAAPKAMLSVYGDANGFGWKENIRRCADNLVRHRFQSPSQTRPSISCCSI